MDILNEARVQLESVVDEDLLKEYFAILRHRFLFSSPMDIEEFDRQARKLLLKEEQITAHGIFLRALLDKTKSETTNLPRTFESAGVSKSSKSSLSRVSQDDRNSTRKSQVEFVESTANMKKYETNISSKSSKHSAGRENHDSIDNGKSNRSVTKRGTFRPAEFVDYVSSINVSKLPQSDLSSRCELFMPDYSFISTKVKLIAWEKGMEGIEGGVINLIVTCCQTFVRNILTAMIARKKSYKVRDGKFQYGFNHPIPDPFLRNYNNIVDGSMESRVDICDDDNSFAPRPKPPAESIEQQVAFAYSSSKRCKTDNVLTIQLLYDTLKDNPALLGSDATRELHLLKLNLMSNT